MDAIKELSLPNNFIKSLIKVAIWTFGWLASVFVGYRDSTITFGSSCLIFAISLLMDMLSTEQEKSKNLSRFFIYGFYCLLFAIIGFSFSLLIQITTKSIIINTLYGLTISVLIILGIRLIITGIFSKKEDTNEDKARAPIQNNFEDINPENVLEKLHEGKLGNIEEETLNG